MPPQGSAPVARRSATASTGRWLNTKRQRAEQTATRGGVKFDASAYASHLSRTAGWGVNAAVESAAAALHAETAQALPIVLTEAALREGQHVKYGHPLMEAPLELRPLFVSGGSKASGAAAAGARTAEFHFQAGFRARAKGDFKGSVEGYDRALALTPDFKAAFNRGYSLQLMGRHTDALAAYDEADSIAPGHVYTAFNKSCCHMALNDATAASKVLRRATAQLQEHISVLRRRSAPQGRQPGTPLSVAAGNYVALLVKFLRAGGYALRASGDYSGACDLYAQATELQKVLAAGGHWPETRGGANSDSSDGEGGGHSSGVNISADAEAQLEIARAAARWGSSGIKRGGRAARNSVLAGLSSATKEQRRANEASEKAAQARTSLPQYTEEQWAAMSPQERSARRRERIDAEVEERLARGEGGGPGDDGDITLSSKYAVAAVLPVWAAEAALQAEADEYNGVQGGSKTHLHPSTSSSTASVRSPSADSRGTIATGTGSDHAPSAKAISKARRVNHLAAVHLTGLRDRARRIPSTSTTLAGVPLRKFGGVQHIPRRTRAGAALTEDIVIPEEQEHADGPGVTAGRNSASRNKTSSTSAARQGAAEDVDGDENDAMAALRTVVSRATLQHSPRALRSAVQRRDDGGTAVGAFKNTMLDRELHSAGKWGLGVPAGDVLAEFNGGGGGHTASSNRARVHLSQSGAASTTALQLPAATKNGGDGSPIPPGSVRNLITHAQATAALLHEEPWQSASTLAEKTRAELGDQLPFFVNSGIPLLSLPMCYADGALYEPAEVRPGGGTLAGTDLKRQLTALLPSLPAQLSAEQSYHMAFAAYQKAKQEALAAAKTGKGAHHVDSDDSLALGGGKGVMFDTHSGGGLKPGQSPLEEPAAPPDPHRRLDGPSIDLLCHVTTRHRLFSGLPGAVHRAIVQRLYVQTCRTGQVITHQGAEAECMFFVLDGSVDAYQHKGATMMRRVSRAQAALKLGKAWAARGRSKVANRREGGDAVEAGGGGIRMPTTPRGAAASTENNDNEHLEEIQELIQVPEYTQGVEGGLKRGVGVPGYEHPKLGSLLGTLMAGEGWGQAAVAQNTSVRDVLERAERQKQAAAEGAPGAKVDPPRFWEATIVAREPTLLLALRRQDYERVVRGTASAVVAGIESFLASVRLFNAATQRERSKLATRVLFRRLACGETLVAQGARLEGLYIIVRGKCSVKQRQQDPPPRSASRGGHRSSSPSQNTRGMNTPPPSPASSVTSAFRAAVDAATPRTGAGRSRPSSAASSSAGPKGVVAELIRRSRPKTAVEPAPSDERDLSSHEVQRALDAAATPAEVRAVITADTEQRMRRLHNRAAQGAELMASMSARGEVEQRGSRGGQRPSTAPSGVARPSSAASQSTVRSLSGSRGGGPSPNEGGDTGAELELGSILPGDWFGEGLVMTSSVHGMVGAQRGAGGLDADEVRALPEAERVAAYDNARRSPATVECDTAAEVIILTRADIFETLSFPTRQRIREMLRKLPSSRRVVTPSQRVAWEGYAKQLVAQELAHKAAERGKRHVWDGFGLSMKEALAAAHLRARTPLNRDAEYVVPKSRQLYTRAQGATSSHQQGGVGGSRPSTAGAAKSRWEKQGLQQSHATVRIGSLRAARPGSRGAAQATAAQRAGKTRATVRPHTAR